MQVHHIGYGIRGFYKLAKLGHLWAMIPKEAQYRLKVLRFWKKYGLETAREAFGVSRRTLYRLPLARKASSFKGGPHSPHTPKAHPQKETSIPLAKGSD